MIQPYLAITKAWGESRCPVLLIRLLMRPECLAVIRGEDDQRVLRNSFSFEQAEESSEVMVNLAAHGGGSPGHSMVLAGIRQMPARNNFVFFVVYLECLRRVETPIRLRIATVVIVRRTPVSIDTQP